MTKIVNQLPVTMDELNDVELDHVSGGDSNLIHVVAVTVANTVSERLIQQAGNGFGKSLLVE